MYGRALGIKLISEGPLSNQKHKIMRRLIARHISMLARCSWTIIILCLLATLPSSAQERFNFNFGGGPGFPLAKTSELANTFYHLVVGGGPNLHPHVKMNFEFMFSAAYLSNRTLSINSASQT